MIDRVSEIRRLLDESTPGERAQAYQALQASLPHHSAADAGFVRHKSHDTLTNTLQNLAETWRHPHVSALGRWMDGQTAFVVGAGPSLERDGPMLQAAAQHGFIVVVNASDAPVRLYGVTPDVFVARESLCLVDQVEASDARVVALDLACTPATWDSAGDRLSWFLPHYPRHVQVAMGLGVRPTPSGTAALTAAVQLAYEWGAARIVLVGVDLAFRSDGRVYHRSADRGDLTVREKQDGAVVLDGNAANDLRCIRSGQTPPPRVQPVETAVSADWSRELDTISTWSDQRRYLEFFSRSRGVETVNASSGGSGIVGWRRETLSAVVDDSRRATRPEPLDIASAACVDPKAVRSLVAELRTAACGMRQEAEMALYRPDLRLLSRYGPAISMPALVEGLTAHELVDAPKSLDVLPRRYYRARRREAAHALRALADVTIYCLQQDVAAFTDPSGAAARALQKHFGLPTADILTLSDDSHGPLDPGTALAVRRGRMVSVTTSGRIFAVESEVSRKPSNTT